MTEREKFIIRAALIYAQANLADLNQAFEFDETEDHISVNGDIGEPIQFESEVEKIIFDFQ
jgi:hypothetical protein